jgi:hypothetical protein
MSRPFKRLRRAFPARCSFCYRQKAPHGRLALPIVKKYALTRGKPQHPKQMLAGEEISFLSMASSQRELFPLP